jgi:hypothetical protein
MLPELKGKGLFVFSDPGGAKPLLSLISKIKNDLIDFRIICDRHYPFFKDFNLNVQMMQGQVEDIFEEFKPDFVLTGTSYTSKIELRFIQQSIELGIKSLAFVDHWTLIRKRFDYDGNEIFPDKILLIDDRAKQIAIEQGIESSKILITGNPYHEWLKLWRPSITKEEFLNQAGIAKGNHKLLIYAPDPLSNNDGVDKFGFDEILASQQIVQLFKDHNTQLKDWIVLVKAHPNQNREKLNIILSESPSFILLKEDIDTNSTIYFADKIIGFFSSFLIEASIMGKGLIRFIPLSAKNDPLASMNIGQLVNENTLLYSIMN